MKDGLDIVQDITSLINVPAVLAAIDGGIWPDVRPDNSNKTDLVVNALGATNDYMQRGFGNINIYVPNVLHMIDSKPQSFPNHKELNNLVKIIKPLVESQDRETFSTELDESPTLMKDRDGSWFINIRLKYRSVQVNYKNI